MSYLIEECRWGVPSPFLRKLGQIVEKDCQARKLNRHCTGHMSQSLQVDISADSMTYGQYNARSRVTFLTAHFHTAHWPVLN